MVYVTESLRLMGQGQYIKQPLEEFAKPRPDYDAEDVLRSVVERGGLVVK